MSVVTIFAVYAKGQQKLLHTDRKRENAHRTEVSDPNPGEPSPFLAWSPQEHNWISDKASTPHQHGAYPLLVPVSSTGEISAQRWIFASEGPQRKHVSVDTVQRSPFAWEDTAEFMTLPQAARYLGRGGKKPSTATLWRWCRQGCRGVNLEYQRFGRELRVTKAALSDFAQRLAAKDRDLGTPVRESRTPAPKRLNLTRRAKEIAESEDFLRKRGLM